jgi:hypothetical protein
MANKKAGAITKRMHELRMQSNIGFSHPHIEGFENTSHGRWLQTKRCERFHKNIPIVLTN